MHDIERIDGVLIVGAGYAGLHAARAASTEGALVTIVDRDGVHGFTTRLAAVAGGTAPIGDAFAPLQAFGHRVRPGRVVGIDDAQVRLHDGSVLQADAVIVTAGSRPISPDVTGIELASALRTPGDAIRLRRRVATADQVSIVGGGATGVQLAGAIASTRPELRVRIVDREPLLLTGMGQALGRHAEAVLADRGVELLLEQQLDEVLPDGLRLDDGRTFDGLVVWAGGFQSVVDDVGPELPQDNDRLQVDPDLTVPGLGRTFAAGDVAAHRDARGDELPMAAQIAVQAGAAAGRNAARLVAGDQPEAAELSHRGWVIDLGGGRGVAKIGPVSLAASALDRLPPLLHHLIDLKHLIEIGGAAGLRFAPGRHRPAEAAIDRLAAGPPIGARP